MIFKLPLERLEEYIKFLNAYIACSDPYNRQVKHCVLARNQLHHTVYSLRRRGDRVREMYTLLQLADRIMFPEEFELAIEGRRLIHEGPLRMRKAKQVRYGFLFNDLLLLVSSLGPKDVAPQEFKYRRIIPLVQVLLRDCESEGV
jgi:hypothetical protein